MSISKFRTLSAGWKVATVAGILGVLGALGLGVVSPAGAASAAGTETPQEVSLAILNGEFTASLCGMDNLEGRCTYDVPPGETATFTVRPGAGEPVQTRVVIRPGGSDYLFTVPQGDRMCFEVGGSNEDPTLTEVTCL